MLIAKKYFNGLATLSQCCVVILSVFFLISFRAETGSKRNISFLYYDAKVLEMEKKKKLNIFEEYYCNEPYPLLQD